MRCFRHQESHATAVCRNCDKATCPDCCEDTGRGVACCAAYSEELRETYRLKNRLKQSFGIRSSPPTRSSVFIHSLFGLILLAVGIFLSYYRPGIDYLTLAMAAMFFVKAATAHDRFRNACLNCCVSAIQSSPGIVCHQHGRSPALLVAMNGAR